MKLIQQILKYFCLLLAILLAVVSCTFCVLMISAKTNPNNPIDIAGYRYYGFSVDKNEVLTNEYPNSSFDAIEISTKSIGVTVKGTNDNVLSLSVIDNSWGLGKVSDDAYGEATYSIELRTINDESVNVLVISYPQPTGMMYGSNSELTLSIPKSFEEKDVTIYTTSASVYVGNGNDYDFLNVEDLTVNTVSGNVAIGNVKQLSSVTIKADRNKVDIDSNVLNDIDYTVDFGTLRFSDAGRIDLDSNNIGVYGDTCSDISLVGSGNIEIGNITNNVMLIGSISVDVANVGGNVDYKNGGSASVEFGTINGFAIITTGNGNVVVNNAKSSAYIETGIGNISIDNAYDMVNIKSTSGICRVNFADNFLKTDLNFESKDGSLNALNIYGAVNATIASKGVCKINLTYRQILGESVINAQKGEVKINAPIYPVVLNASSESYLDISFGGLTVRDSKSIVNEYISNAVETSEDKLSVTSTSGKISIKAIIAG